MASVRILAPQLETVDVRMTGSGRTSYATSLNTSPSISGHRGLVECRPPEASKGSE